MSRYTEFVNEGFHNVFHRRPPNGNAASLSLGRTLRRHPMNAEVDLPIQMTSYSFP